MRSCFEKVNKKFLWTALTLCVLSAFSAAASQAAIVAIVVNKQNPANDLSYEKLVKIFKAEKQFWDDGQKIYLILRETGSLEKQVLLQTVYRMDEVELKKYWLAKIFRQEIPSFPKTLSSSEAVKRFVSQVPNAVGVIDARSMDDTVKALTIDGKSFHDEGYSLIDPSR